MAGAMETLEENLRKAEANLKRELDRWDNYSGNNPSKFKSDIKWARGEVDTAKYAITRAKADVEHGAT